MSQMMLSTKWQMSRTKAMPAPIGCPVVSLIRLMPSALLPQDWPVFPAWNHRLYAVTPRARRMNRR